MEVLLLVVEDASEIVDSVSYESPQNVIDDSPVTVSYSATIINWLVNELFNYELRKRGITNSFGVT